MPPKIRIPRPEDFAALSPQLNVSLHSPSPPESTTAILILFHGLGDSETSFGTFARNMNLPGVLAIAVRGTSPLPPALLGGLSDDIDTSGPPRHFHWGDDLTLAAGGAGGAAAADAALDTDPGFAKAYNAIMTRLVRETLLDGCGWEMADIMLFGFGQGGSLALGMASQVREGFRVEEVKSEEESGSGSSSSSNSASKAFKGVVSIGGPLPVSMVSTISARSKARTPVLVCRGRACEAVDDEAVEAIQREFVNVREVKWRKAESGMPANREEMLPVMQFFAERLRSGW
ncbi:Alpha/Beta hydrolase protein [Coniella lustricola]|uniref:Alpha/Beta hydrolase protein n=1 Tax=Coniella lustricola TaxID=2025994 RepID=A0A2T3A8P8_9PEZI|nr:Alpha/Beta hydrolase protein [Coniella lustricola]